MATVYTHNFTLEFPTKTISGEMVFNSGHTPALHIEDGVEMSVIELAFFNRVIVCLSELYKESGGFSKFKIINK